MKLCGFTRLEDVLAASTLDLDALGFVFASDAREPLTEETAAPLLAAAAVPGLVRIAVVGTASIDDCKRFASLGFDALQVVVNDWFEPEVNGVRVVPVFFDSLDVEGRIEDALRGWVPSGESIAETVCLDGAGGGGRGQSASRERAARLAQRWPLMLAGGLRPDTVGQAIVEVGPRAVDVSSGIEVNPGQKDRGAMADFVQAVRRVG